MQKSLKRITFIIMLMYILNLVYIPLGCGKYIKSCCEDIVKVTLQQVQTEDIINVSVLNMFLQGCKSYFGFANIRMLSKSVSNIFRQGKGKEVKVCQEIKSMETKSAERRVPKENGDKGVLFFGMDVVTNVMAILQIGNNLVEKVVAKIIDGSCVEKESGCLSGIPIYVKGYIFLILILKLMCSVLPRSVSIKSNGNKNNIDVQWIKKFCI